MPEKKKYKYLKLKHVNYRVWDARDVQGNTCPHCGKPDISFKRVEVQLSFWQHTITSYAICQNCGKRFAWLEGSQMKAAKLLKLIDGIYERTETE